MRGARGLFLVIVSAIVLGMPARVRAEEAPTCSRVTRDNLIRCAVDASAAIRMQREGVAAADARRVATSPWFPRNATLTLSAAQRVGPGGGPTVFNYYATLAQEIEIAGQRSARRAAAEADVAANKEDLAAVTRRAAAAAYVAYFDALAARDALAVAQGLEATARQIARVTQERADTGVGSPLDATLAEAASLRVVQNRVEAERTVQKTGIMLAVLLGRDAAQPPPAIEGDLEPLHGVDAITGSSTPRLVLDRPELRALRFTRRAYEARADVFRRARVPNVTLQLYAQNDGFNERVLGGGLVVPLPLPRPIGRMYAGEIAESEALARRTEQEAEVSRRALSGSLAAAIAEYRSRREEAGLFTKDRVARAERLLSEIGKEIEAGRLPVRDALVAQQRLIDVLHGWVDTRHALCLASVELAFAAGVPLEAGGR